MITLPAAVVVNRWLVVELVDALLRPVFCAWRKAQRDGNEARAAVLGRRFYNLVNGCDCWPCSIVIDHCGLYVGLDSRADGWEDDL